MLWESLKMSGYFEDIPIILLCIGNLILILYIWELVGSVLGPHIASNVSQPAGVLLELD